MRRDRRKFLIFGGTALVAAGLGACGEAASPDAATGTTSAAVIPPGRLDAEIGETIERDGLKLTVQRVLATYSFGGFENAPSGTFYVTLEMTIDNGGSSAVDTSFAATELELAGGGEGKPDLAAAGTNLPQVGPQPGQSTIGWRTFNVPDGTKAATFVFKPNAETEIRIGFVVPTDIQSRMIGV